MHDPEDRITPVTLRKRAKVTQRKVAEALDVRQGTISDWERGIAIPHLRPSQIKVMMQLFKCSIDELIEAFESPKAN